MNTASLELCKELYELSGWRNHGDLVFTDNARDVDDVPEERTVPLYDLGYLLRKLPGYLKLEHTTVDGVFTWRFYHSEKIQLIGDTPEDCAAKLAIELWKQGVLK